MARLGSFLAIFGLGVVVAVRAEPSLQDVIDQNQRLQEQVRAQQKVIDELSAQMAEMRKASERQDRELQGLQDRAESPAAERSAPEDHGESLVRLSGEAGLAFFRTGPAGQFPNSEFRVDDAKLFVEAQVWKNVYAVSEIDLMTREASDENVYLGAFYADFENVSALWGVERAVNVRVGRFPIPFGEEYQVRGVMDNPLISHSLSDVWGFDQGVEAYGQAGGLQYVVAVQNGGASRLHDFNSDKSVTARVGADPAAWLHLSASAMRTGDLSMKSDTLSAVWFGNAFFRALGPAATTQTFHAELYEADGTGRWKTGHVTAAAGRADFDDDDTTADNARKMNYWFVEGLQEIGDGFYGVARYSAIHVPKGYPLAGFGNAGNYFYNPFATLTQNLSRMSVGFGYRIGPPLVLKFEYSRERGQLVNGVQRDREDFLSTEVGLKF